jgi:hypothetical protein
MEYSFSSRRGRCAGPSANQSENARYNKIKGHDVTQQPRDKENQYPRDQGHQGLQEYNHMHLFSSPFFSLVMIRIITILSSF